jgi:hypothetical protein
MVSPESFENRIPASWSSFGARKNFIELVPASWSILDPLFSTQLSDFKCIKSECGIPCCFGSFRALLSQSWPNRRGGNTMRFRTVLCLASLFVVCFTIAAWSTPIPDRLVPGDPEAEHPNLSLSGSISSIRDAEFSVDVQKNRDVKTVQFLVDDNTKVEGKLAVGAQATVEYRTNGEKNIAVRVVVVPAAGMSLY